MAIDQHIGYKDVNPFFQHINWLLEKEAEARWKYNDILQIQNVSPLTQQLIHLEDWYMTLETLYDRIIGKLEEEDIALIDQIKRDIEEVTKGDNFASLSLASEEIIQIRSNCRKLSRELNVLLWKHKIHIDLKPNKIPGMVW